MDRWDAQKMFDKYILDYMIKKEMYVAAATFAKEANVSLDPVAIQSDEGFLREWWSVFSKVYSEATEGSSEVSTHGFLRNNNSPGQPQTALPTAASMPSSGVVDHQEKSSSRGGSEAEP